LSGAELVVESVFVNLWRGSLRRDGLWRHAAP